MKILSRTLFLLISTCLVVCFAIQKQLEAQSVPADQRVQLPFSSTLKVDNTLYSGDAKIKIVIVDESGITRWSNDLSSVRGSQPENYVEIEVVEGNFLVELGSEQMEPLAASAFNGNSKLSALIWIDAGKGFQRFDPITLGTSPRSANAIRLGGVAAEQYLRVGAFIPIDSGNIVAPIDSSRIAAFSNRGNDFTIGDGADENNKKIVVNTSAETDPAIRFNTESNKWQFSNNGTSYKDFASTTSSEFQGPGSITDSIDLGTDEVLGILPIIKGGTGSSSAADARDGLGIKIGRDVAAFQKNNFLATSDPGPTDDSNTGYSVGSRWTNTATNKEFTALSVVTGAAIWRSTTSSSLNSIEDGAIVNSKLATDAVTSDKILDASVAAADIGPDAVGNSELMSTSVVPGTYNAATLTVDADGRITSASSNPLDGGDITAIGNAISGDAFIDGTSNGTELVYEGATVNSFENRLAFDGDPTSDTIVTIPNTTGIIITSGDTGTIGPAMIVADSLTAGELAPDSVTANEIAADAVTSSEIALDAVGASEITANAVGASELSSTSVAPGTYNFASITVDADGRITSASGNSESGDISAVGDVTSGPAFTEGDTVGSEFVFEGITDNAFENRLKFSVDPTTDTVVTIPNTTGTLITSGDIGTITSSMIVSETITPSELASDSVTAGEIAADAVGSSEITANAVGASEIAADAVGASELSSTTVSPGTYNLASITVDAD
jgi:hypothetical protein